LNSALNIAHRHFVLSNKLFHYMILRASNKHYLIALSTRVHFISFCCVMT